MKVTIIIRAFNCENTVAAAIESTLDQNFTKNNFEVIVVNDGSKDNTRKVLSSYEDHRNLIILDQKNAGPIKAANKGFSAANGEYVVLLDCDDILERSFLSEEVSVLDKDAGACFVYSDYYEKFKDRTKLVSVGNIFQTVAGGVMYRKSKLSEINFYRESVFFAEYDLILRTLNLWKSFHIKKPLFTYNRNLKSLTANQSRVRSGLLQLNKLHPDRRKEVEKIRSYVIKA